MKPTFIVSLLAAAASLVSAAPTEKSIEARDHHERFYPDVMIQIKEHEPDHAFGDTYWGLVSRRNGKENVQTLLSIHIPHHVQGQKCRYTFSQPHDLGGSMSAQVFTVIGKIPLDATFNKRPSRDRHVATFKTSWAHAQGEADFEFFGGKEFDCPAGHYVNLEIVPVGDNDYIEWYDPYGFAIETVHW